MNILRFIDSSGKLQEFCDVRMSTGLVDKKGNEIFEGDIIVQPQSDRPYAKNRKYHNVTMKVVWSDGGGERGRNPNLEASEYNRNNLKEDPSCYNCRPSFRGDILSGKSGCKEWSEFASCEVIKRGEIRD